MNELKQMAIDLLKELRGMERAELSGDEIYHVTGIMERAYILGFNTGKTKGYIQALGEEVAEEASGPVCEGCSDGGHYEGQ